MHSNKAHFTGEGTRPFPPEAPLLAFQKDCKAPLRSFTIRAIMVLAVFYLLLLGFTVWAYRQKEGIPTPQAWEGSSASDHGVWALLCMLVMSLGFSSALLFKNHIPELLAGALGLHGPLLLLFAITQRWPLWFTPPIFFERNRGATRTLFISYLRCWIPLMLVHLAMLAMEDIGSVFHLWPKHEPLTGLAEFLGPQVPWTQKLPTILLLGVVAPISEEYFWRGVLFPVFLKKLSPKPAALLCAALFASAHADIVGWPTIAWLGYILCRLYERHRNLWIPIGVHTLFNIKSLVEALYFTGIHS